MVTNKEVLLKLSYLIILLIALQNRAKAQTNENIGIKFRNDIEWKLILSEAKKDAKFIFVDCYASWCLPCKEMEKNIYSDSSVANVVNTHFISVKLMMDTPKIFKARDYNVLRNADSLDQKYQIRVYPTFLFLSADGEMIFRDEGYKNTDHFISMLNMVFDSASKYQALLLRYARNDLDFESMRYLVIKATSLGNDKLATKIAERYINDYLLKIPAQELLTKRNIDFIATYTKSADSKGFALFINRGPGIDSLMTEYGYSRDFIDHVIYLEYIRPFLPKKGSSLNPRWTGIRNSLLKKYSVEVVDRNIVTAKFAWYDKKDWSKFIKYGIERIQNYGMTNDLNGDYTLNYVAWNIFLHSENCKQLTLAIQWMEGVVKRIGQDTPPVIDTYANLMYKMGRREEAIGWEQKAHDLDTHEVEFQRNLNKMKKNIPTWSN